MGHKYWGTDRVTTVNLRGWLCNKISGCLPGEIPCGLKASRLINRLLLPHKGGDCYAIAEQAIELLLFICFIYSCCPQIKTLVVCHQSAPEDKVVL